MSVELFGYSERGMINALCDDLLHRASDSASSVSTFLSWFDFAGSQSPPCFSNIKNATLLVEQSFSDFGDLDLLILLEHHDAKPQAIFVEAKVSNDTASWLAVEDRWNGFVSMLDGGEWNTSNLFVQLYRKVRLVELILGNGAAFEPDIFTPRGSFGRNQVVSRAIAKLKEFIDERRVWYCAILPDEAAALESFARETLHENHIEESLKKWNVGQWGFLSWQTIDDMTKSGWPRTQANFKWNNDQIFRVAPPLQHRIQAGQIYLWGSRRVFVVSEGRGLECRVVDLDARNDRFFWKTEKANVNELSPCDASITATILPTIPRTGAVYTWDCQTDFHRMPPSRTKVEISSGTSVIVVRPSWFTTRVRKKDSPVNAPDFPVYTHHLQRTISGV